MMKNILSLSEQEKKIMVNEFIVESDLKERESISIELLQFFKKRNMKILNAELFNEMLEIIELKYLKS